MTPRRHSLYAAVILSLMAGACATPPTRATEARGDGEFGYDDEKKAAGVYKISYTVNDKTEHEAVRREYIPFRGGQLCREDKMGYWEVRDLAEVQGPPYKVSATIVCFKKDKDGKAEADLSDEERSAKAAELANKPTNSGRRYSPSDYKVLRSQLVTVPWLEDVFEDKTSKD